MDAFEVGTGAFGVGAPGVNLPTTEQDLEQLNRAMSAGYGTDHSSYSGGAALRMESLEATLTSTTYTEKHCKIWGLIHKDKAYSTVEEYTRLTDHGNDAGGFILEGEAPESTDATLQRMAAFVKYVGTTRSVTHQMTMVKSLADAVEVQNRSGAAWLIRQVNRALYFGNSKLGFNGAESAEFDGLQKQIDSGNVVNAAYTALSKDHLKSASQLVLDGYGTPDTVFCGFDSWSQFSEGYLGDAQRIVTPVPGTGVKAGVLVDELVTQGGVVKFQPDIFLRASKAAPASATSDKAPTAPASIAAAALTGTDGAFASTGAGVYKYSVTACNRFGESAPTALSGAVTFTSPDLAKHVPLTITNAASITIAPEYYNVYRTEVGGSIAYLIASIPAISQAASGTTTWNDVNDRIPRTASVFVGQNDADVLSYRQLTPLLKMDLAILGPAYRWMLLMYGVMILRAPKKWAEIKNIKVV